MFQKKGIRIGILSYCINDEGCTQERGKTFIGPAIYNEKEVEEDLINLRKVLLLSSFICVVFTKTNSSAHMFAHKAIFSAIYHEKNVNIIKNIESAIITDIHFHPVYKKET